jgi:hypothetical protein
MSNGRKVSTDALETLGTIIDDTQKRDAIHIAVLPVVAGERLHAGQDIGVEDGKALTKAKHHGIVDPFVKGPIQEGQRFWMLLYPRMVTSLRHVWSHPAFADDATGSEPSKNAESEAWLDGYADKVGVSRGELIEAANDRIDRGSFWSEGGRFEGEFVPEEFWPHFENVTGRKVPSEDRNNFFSCSC